MQLFYCFGCQAGGDAFKFVMLYEKLDFPESVEFLAKRWGVPLPKASARPEDDDHAYGHSKAEYFSSGVEGALILVAAASIAWFAVGRLLHPVALTDVGRKLLDGQADWVRLNGIDRWLGGVHLQGAEAAWRRVRAKYLIYR